MNAMLQTLSVGGTPEEVAEVFIKDHEDVWRPWLGTVAAEPVQSQ
jgi:ABC-type proline/glycine betaine transport system substrate-binding protein